MTTTKAFPFTGAPQPFTVPGGVFSISITAFGAAGGGTWGPAYGGFSQGVLAVTPGETLWVYVGGKGANTGAGGALGGWNGGGGGGASTSGLVGCGGGGASDVRQGGQALANRKIVAGGGGGQGRFTNGGGGGGLTGAKGGATGGSWGGNGGTQSAGGTVAGSTGSPTAGALGVGGNGGGNSSPGNSGGGGGGGGYYGGAGGALAVGGAQWGQGGGGSGYIGGVTSGGTSVGTWSAGNGSINFTFNTPPNAPTLTTPPQNGAVDATVAPTVQWQFSDPDPGDLQSSADVQYRAPGDSFTVVTAAAASVGSYTFPAPLVADTTYEWQVRTYDQSGAVSPWSASGFFTPRTPPAAPTIVSPPAGSAITADPAPYQWTPSGAQSGYEIVLCADNAGSADLTRIYSDTAVSGSTATATVPLQAKGVAQGQLVHVRVRTYTYPGVWSPWTDWGAQTLNLNPPGVPTLQLIPDVDAGSIVVQITNPAGPFPTQTVDLYRTDLTVGGAEMRIQTGLPAGSSVTDATPASGHEYRYRALAYSLSGGLTSSD